MREEEKSWKEKWIFSRYKSVIKLCASITSPLEKLIAKAFNAMVEVAFHSHFSAFPQCRLASLHFPFVFSPPPPLNDDVLALSLIWSQPRNPNDDDTSHWHSVNEKFELQTISMNSPTREWKRATTQQLQTVDENFWEIQAQRLRLAYECRWLSEQTADEEEERIRRQAKASQSQPLLSSSSSSSFQPLTISPFAFSHYSILFVISLECLARFIWILKVSESSSSSSLWVHSSVY